MTRLSRFNEDHERDMNDSTYRRAYRLQQTRLAFRMWLVSLVCKMRGHDERRVMTRGYRSPDGSWTVQAGYIYCERCDVTLRTWGE